MSKEQELPPLGKAHRMVLRKDMVRITQPFDPGDEVVHAEYYDEALAQIATLTAHLGSLQRTINELAGGAAQGMLLHGRRMKAEAELAALREGATIMIKKGPHKPRHQARERILDTTGAKG